MMHRYGDASTIKSRYIDIGGASTHLLYASFIYLDASHGCNDIVDASPRYIYYLGADASTI